MYPIRIYEENDESMYYVHKYKYLKTSGHAKMCGDSGHTELRDQRFEICGYLQREVDDRLGRSINPISTWV